MSRLAIAVGLAFVCSSVYAQPGAHGPPTTGPSTTNGQGLTRGSSHLSQQGASARAAGMSRSIEQSSAQSAGFSMHMRGNRSLSGRSASSRSNLSRDDKQKSEKHSSATDAADSTKSAMRAARARAALEKLTGLERALQVQLATADRMRDRAIETSDPKMLERADEFERKARARFAELTATPEPGEPAPETPGEPETDIPGEPEEMPPESDGDAPADSTPEPSDDSGN